MTREETLHKEVYDLLEDQLGINPTSISDSSRLAEDLGADSLDLVEITMYLDNTFDIEIPDEEAEKFITVRDIIDYLRDNTNP